MEKKKKKGKEKKTQKPRKDIHKAPFVAFSLSRLIRALLLSFSLCPDNEGALFPAGIIGYN